MSVPELFAQAQQLSHYDQLQLLEKLANFLRTQAEPPHPHSIMELQGLGKTIWKDIDAKQYVEQERASWNG